MAIQGVEDDMSEHDSDADRYGCEAYGTGAVPNDHVIVPESGVGSQRGVVDVNLHGSADVVAFCGPRLSAVSHHPEILCTTSHAVVTVRGSDVDHVMAGIIPVDDSRSTPLTAGIVSPVAA